MPKESKKSNVSKKSKLPETDMAKQLKAEPKKTKKSKVEKGSVDTSTPFGDIPDGLTDLLD